MALEWTRTSKADERRLRILIHGQSGAGKTWLARTVPDVARCLLIAIEPGELSLADVDMPMVRLGSPSDLAEVCRMLGTEKNRTKFDWVFVDSISAFADNLLDEELTRNKDPRAAYGEMQRKVIGAVRESLGTLPQHVVCTCRQERVNLDGKQVLVPGMPGQALTHKAPIAHEFDAVWSLIVRPGRDGEAAQRWLITDPAADPSVLAKTRDPFGRVAAWEAPDIGAIAARLLAPNSVAQTQEVQ